MTHTDETPPDGLLLGGFILVGTAALTVVGALAGIGVIAVTEIRERRLQRQKNRRGHETCSEEEVVGGVRHVSNGNISRPVRVDRISTPPHDPPRPPRLQPLRAIRPHGVRLDDLMPSPGHPYSGYAGPLTGGGGGGGGSALQPDVEPNLLTDGMPAVGAWWINLPKYGSGNMFELTIIGYVFAPYGGGFASFNSGRIQFTSLAAPNQGCGWSQATSEVDISCRPWMRGRVKVGATAADQGVWIGWVAGGALSGTGSVSNNTLALSCETVAIVDGGKGQTTWQVTSKETGAVDYVDTLVPYTAGHDYETYLAISGSDVVWAIYDHTSSTAYSGTCVAKANLPASGTGLGVLYTGISGVGGAALVLTWGACTRGFFGPA